MINIKRIAIILIICLFCTGCGTPKSAESTAADSNNSRFVKVEYYYKSLGPSAIIYYVMYDKYTKVMYIITPHGSAEPLYDPEGKPLLWEEN